MAFKTRQGTEAQRLLLSGTSTPASGEPLWVTDYKKYYMGDGVTVGGIFIGPGVASGTSVLFDVITCTTLITTGSSVWTPSLHATAMTATSITTTGITASTVSATTYSGITAPMISGSPSTVSPYYFGWSGSSAFAFGNHLTVSNTQLISANPTIFLNVTGSAKWGIECDRANNNLNIYAGSAHGGNVNLTYGNMYVTNSLSATTLCATTIYSGGVNIATLWGSVTGITVHSGLTGLLNNDHPQYRLTANTIPASSVTSGTFAGSGVDFTFPRYVYADTVVLSGDNIYINTGNRNSAGGLYVAASPNTAGNFYYVTSTTSWQTSEKMNLLNTLKATTISGSSFVSGSTNLSSIFAPVAHTHSATAITSGTFGSGTFVFPGNVSASSLSATTIVSPIISGNSYYGNVKVVTKSGTTHVFSQSADTSDGRAYSLSSALSLAQSGDTVIVGPGNYNSIDILKTGVNYYFEPGSIIEYTGSTATKAIFDTNSASTNNIIGGCGTFINSGNSATSSGRVVFGINSNSSVKINCDKIEAANGVAIRTSGVDQQRVDVFANEIYSKDGTIDNVAPMSTIFVKSNIIRSSSGYAIEQDGGTTIINSSIVESSSALPPLAWGSSGVMKLYNCEIVCSSGVACSEGSMSTSGIQLYNCTIDSSASPQCTGKITLSNCVSKDGAQLTSDDTINLLDGNHPQYRLTASTISASQITTGSFGSGSFIFPDSVSASTYSGIVHTKSMTVPSPTATENIPMWYTNRAITFTKIQAVVRGTGTPTVTWWLGQDIDRSASPADPILFEVVSSGATSGTTYTSFAAANVPANNWVLFYTTATGGTSVNDFHITLEYKED